VDPGRLFLALRRNWKWLPIAMLVGAVVGVAFAKLIVQRNYTATTVLIWEPDLSGDGGSGQRDLATRVQSVRLPANLLEVRRRLALGVSLKVLEARTSARAEPNSLLVTVTASDAQPGPAATLADTVVEVFLEHETRLAQARAQETLQKIESDLDVARTKLANARETYDAFRTEHGIADLAAETQIAIQQVAELRSNADMARADAESLQARATRLESEARRQSSHQMQGATQTDPVRTQLASVRAQLAATSGRLAEDHPTVLALEAQAQALQAEVDSGGTTTSSTVTIGLNAQVESLKMTMSQSAADREAALQRQDAYKRFAAEAELRLQKLSSVEGQASTLLANITLHEGRVRRLEGELATLGDVARAIRPEFRSLTPALVPEEAESSRKKIAIASPFFAALLVLLVLVGRELRGLKVMTASEAGFWLDGPVIASTNWPSDADTLPPLVDELTDHAALSVGTTLVLAATQDEAPLAREIAYWLGNVPRGEKRMLGAHSETGADEARAPRKADPLAVRPDVETPTAPVAQTWEGELDSQATRRAARLAHRVLLVVRSGSLSMTQLAQVHTRLGRDSGVGVLLVGLDGELLRLRDRVGDVEGYWQSTLGEVHA